MNTNLINCESPTCATVSRLLSPKSSRPAGRNGFTLIELLDEGQDYTPSYDLAAIYNGGTAAWATDMQNQYGGGPLERFNYDPEHQLALNPQSGGGTLLVTDNALFVNQTGAQGATGQQIPWITGPLSNYVDEGLGNALPAGEHEMYNDGSVRWVPMSNIKVRFSWINMAYQGW